MPNKKGTRCTPPPATTSSLVHGDLAADAERLYMTFSGDPADWSSHAAYFLAMYPPSQERTNAMRAGRKARLMSPKYDATHPDHPNA